MGNLLAFMIIKQILSLVDNYIYIAINLQTKNAFVVDPSVDQEVILYIEKEGLNLTHILNTHHHSDHIGGNEKIKQKYNAKILASKYDDYRIKADLYLAEGDHLQLNGYDFEVLFLPGHTSGHIAYYFPIIGALFCGDVLFSGGCGRVFEGTYEEMFLSLNRLVSLPETTKIYSSHEYTLSNLQFALSVEPDNKELQLYFSKVQDLRNKNYSTLPTNLGLEKKINPFLRTNSREIRRNLKMQNESDLEIFTKLRMMKNQFS